MATIQDKIELLFEAAGIPKVVGAVNDIGKALNNADGTAIKWGRTFQGLNDKIQVASAKYKAGELSLKSLLSVYRETNIALQNLITQFTKVDAAGRSYFGGTASQQFKIRALQSALDSMGNTLSKDANVFIRAAGGVKVLADTAGLSASKVKELGVSLKGTGMEADAAGKKVSQHSDMIEVAIGKLIRYRVAYMLMRGTIDQVKASLQEFIKINSQLGELAIVVDPIVNSMEGIRVTAVDMGRQFGVTTEDVLKSFNTWARVGLQGNAIIEATKATLIGVNTLGLSTTDMTDALTSAMFTYGVAAGDLTTTISQWLRVANAFPLSGADLANALRAVGSAASEVGIDLRDLSGYIAAINAVTRKSGTAIGQSLKTQLARIVKPETERLFNLAGVAVRATAEEFRDFDDVLDDLSKNWDKLSQVQQINIATAVGGIRRYVDFLALMEAYDIKQRAVALALTATNEAVNANKIAMATAAKQFEASGVSLAKFHYAIGSKLVPALADLARTGANVLDKLADTSWAIKAISGIIKYSTTIGVAIISATALVYAFKGLLLLAPILKAFFVEITLGAQMAATGVATLGYVIKSVSATTWITLLAVGVASLIAAFDLFGDSADDLNQNFEGLTLSTEENSKAAHNAINGYKMLGDSLDSLNETVSKQLATLGNSKKTTEQHAMAMDILSAEALSLSGDFPKLTQAIYELMSAQEGSDSLAKVVSYGKYREELDAAKEKVEQLTGAEKNRFAQLLKNDIIATNANLKLAKENQSGYSIFEDLQNQLYMASDPKAIYNSLRRLREKVQESSLPKLDQKEYLSSIDRVLDLAIEKFKIQKIKIKDLTTVSGSGFSAIPSMKEVYPDTIEVGLSVDPKDLSLVSKSAIEITNKIKNGATAAGELVNKYTGELSDLLKQQNEISGNKSEYIPITEATLAKLVSARDKFAEIQYKLDAIRRTKIFDDNAFNIALTTAQMLGEKFNEQNEFVKQASSNYSKYATQLIAYDEDIYKKQSELNQLTATRAELEGKLALASRSKQEADITALTTKIANLGEDIATAKQNLDATEKEKEALAELVEILRMLGSFLPDMKLSAIMEDLNPSKAIAGIELYKQAAENIYDILSRTGMREENLLDIKARQVEAVYNMRIAAVDLEDAEKKQKSILDAQKTRQSELLDIEKQRLLISDEFKSVLSSVKIGDSISEAFKGDFTVNFIDNATKAASLREEIADTEISLQKAIADGDAEATINARQRLKELKGDLSDVTNIVHILSNAFSKAAIDIVGEFNKRLSDNLITKIMDITIGGETIDVKIGRAIETAATGTLIPGTQAVFAEAATKFEQYQLDHTNGLMAVFQWHVKSMENIFGMKAGVEAPVTQSTAKTTTQTSDTSGYSMGIPNWMIERAINTSNTKDSKTSTEGEKDIVKAIRAMSSYLGNIISQSFGTMLGGGSSSAATGAGLGSMVGAAWAKDLFGAGSSAIMSMLIPGVGSIVGGAIGGIIGGLFSGDSEASKLLTPAIIENTKAIQANTSELKQLDATMFNAPSNFIQPLATGGSSNFNVSIVVNGGGNSTATEIRREIEDWYNTTMRTTSSTRRYGL